MPQTNPGAAGLTEVRMVRTAFGFAKLAESRRQGALETRQLPDGVRLVPYVEGEVICGVYAVDRARAQDMGKGRIRYPIVDTVPFFLLDERHRSEVFDGMKVAGIALRPPEEQDLTSACAAELQRSQVTWRNQDAEDFDFAAFAASVHLVRASPDFPGVYLVKTADHERWVLSIGKLIEDVIDLHPHFIRLEQPKAVRLTYAGNVNVWLAPLLRSGTVA